jgi:cobalt-zinc-cadmium efflux system outer membrane protein
MKTLIFCCLMMSTAFGLLKAQDSFDAVLAEIETNNTTLLAMQQQADASKLNSRTGIYLQNPEIGFHYLWRNPSVMGNRVDVSISQSFDFPSAYKHKSNIADLQVGQADLEYRLTRVNILYEAKLICIDLVFNNTLMAEKRKLLEYAQNIAEAVGKMYENGESGILENNKAQFNLQNLQNDLGYLEADSKALLSELARLNGGSELSFSLEQYPLISIPEDFDEWYAMVEQSNPVIQFMNKQVEISENTEKLNRAMSLPKFSAGYMSEAVIGDQFQGLTLGMSIPLWENKNTVKAARAQTVANIAIANDSRLQLHSELKSRHQNALNMKKASEGYYTSITAVNTSELLKKAYDMGEISLIEYLVEVQFYYDIMIKALETRRMVQIAVADLEKWN